jgi:hypothetical protein
MFTIKLQVGTQFRLTITVPTAVVIALITLLA